MADDLIKYLAARQQSVAPSVGTRGGATASWEPDDSGSILGLKAPQDVVDERLAGLQALAANPSDPYAPLNVNETVMPQLPAGAKPYMATTGQTTSRTVTPGIDLPEAFGAEEQAAVLHSAANVDAAQRAASGAMDRVNEQLSEAALQASDEAVDATERQRILRQEYDAAKAQTDQAMRDYMGSEVNPGRLWASRNAFQKVLGVLGIGLGGALEAMTNGAVKNPALGIIERAIDRDIAAQEMNLRRKGDSVRMQQSALGALYRELGDMQQAKLALRARHMDALAQQAMVQGRKLNAVATGAQLASQLRSGAMRDQMAIAEARADRVQQTTSTQRQMVDPSASLAAMPQQLLGASNQFDDKHSKQIEGLENISNAFGDLADLQSMYNSSSLAGRSVPFSETRDQLKAQFAKIAVSLRQAKENGVMTDADVKRWTSMIQPSKGLLSSPESLNKKLKTIMLPEMNRLARRLQLTLADQWRNSAGGAMPMSRDGRAQLPPRLARAASSLAQNASRFNILGEQVQGK